MSKSVETVSVRKGAQGTARRERGWVFVIAPVAIVGVMTMAGLAFDGFRVFREDEEQERLARSIGIVMLKAYNLAGCEYDWDNNNEKRVQFAIKAAMEAMDVEGDHALPTITMPSTGTSAPIQVVFNDSSGATRGSAKIRFGSVPSEDSKELGPLLPCRASPVNPNQRLLSGTDDWESGQTYSAGMIPPSFNWLRYLLSNPDLRERGLDTRVEAERHFAKYGFMERRKGTTPALSEPHLFLAAEVTVEGLSSVRRTTGLGKLFGVNRMATGAAKATVVHEVHPVQMLQIEQIDVARDVHEFRAPTGLQTGLVSYTMSMDVTIERAAPSWRNIFNSGVNDLGIDVAPNVLSRCPALFVSGSDAPPANRLHVVHCARGDFNRNITTTFAARAGETFNITWTVDDNGVPDQPWAGQLKTYINGVLDPTGTVNGQFQWSEAGKFPVDGFTVLGQFEPKWTWNSYRNLSSIPSYVADSSIKVSSVLWVNRPLSPTEVQALALDRRAVRNSRRAWTELPFYLLN